MLTRRYPEREMTPLRTALEWAFQDPLLTANRWLETGMTQPSIDVRETDDAFVVEIEMPGVKPDDAEVTLDGRTLAIRGHYREEHDPDGGKGGRYLMHERRSGSFARLITLPGEIDPEKVTSSFENGELMISLPKAAQTRARRIPISMGAGGARRVGPGEGGMSSEQGQMSGSSKSTGQQSKSSSG